jgi:hypothetical protein
MLNQWNKKKIVNRFLRGESIDAIAITIDLTRSDVESIVRNKIIKGNHKSELVPIVRSSICLKH